MEEENESVINCAVNFEGTSQWLAMTANAPASKNASANPSSEPPPNCSSPVAAVLQADSTTRSALSFNAEISLAKSTASVSLRRPGVRARARPGSSEQWSSPGQ